MTDINSYNNDGANHQARAVLAMLQGTDCLVENSWNAGHRKYDAEPKVARWENCREQGYVISLRTKDFKKQLNIAFFEHRNSDSICAVKWEQSTLNSPTIDTAEFGDVYKDKYDTSHDVGYGEVMKMAEWIKHELEKFWEENHK
jgi:hypothetical protein